MGGKAFLCEVCDGEPLWRLLRRGDAVVSWACPQHMSAVAERLQRDSEVTELVVTHEPKAREWAEIGQALGAIEGGGEG